VGAGKIKTARDLVGSHFDFTARAGRRYPLEVVLGGSIGIDYDIK
jgi:hypothetical protein